MKGAELALVAGGIERALNVLMVNPKIKKPDDLKGKRVAISYHQHKGVPSSCFGETEYFVSDVKVVE